MFYLIVAIIFIILFIIFCIAGGNYLLRSMVDNALSKNTSENFQNINDIKPINPIDDCRKIDIERANTLNFQTATNIPLSPNYYKNYVGSEYVNDDLIKEPNELKNGKYCLRKSKLLYDGIWDPNITNESPYQYESWKLTNGNLTDGYYCSNKLVEVNKPFPKDYLDLSSTPPITSGTYYTYFNDTQDDILDTEIVCFDSFFNAGITEDLKKKWT